MLSSFVRLKMQTGMPITDICVKITNFGNAIAEIDVMFVVTYIHVIPLYTGF